ncbi:permease [Paenibacillus turpanensis]|uniref:permease n=1 Tax=Paenibacillus turpanensis TaxID=2689078 RepID=UPI001407DDF7|nr:permease [Paenibacillus turpanensis]
MEYWSSDTLQNFKALFFGIVLEAFPFLLLGVLLSSLLQVFIKEDTIRKLMPRHPVIAVMISGLLGLLLPICECGAIPVVRRLIQKGMPVYAAMTFVLAGPVVNPVVFASTFMAFRSQPEMAYSRIGLAFAAAVAVGLLLYRFVRTSPLRGAGRFQMAHGHDHHHGTSAQPFVAAGRAPENRFFTALGHASDEFFEMGKYLLFGALITALIQVGISREWLVSLGQSGLQSHLFMMGFAYLLSLCSTSDAFVAVSFAGTFSAGSLLTFLVFGPMIDLKGTIMLLSAFRTKFVILVSGLTAIIVLGFSLLFEAWKMF